MSVVYFTDRDLGLQFAHGVRFLVIIGHAPYPELARSFVATRLRVEAGH